MHNVSLTAFSHSQLLTKRRKLSDRSLHSKNKKEQKWEKMCRNMTANSNKVIYLYADIPSVPRGKQFVKAMAVTNKLLFVIIQNWKIKKKKEAIPEAIIHNSSGLVSVAVLFSRDSTLNAAALGNYMTYSSKKKWQHTFRHRLKCCSNHNQNSQSQQCKEIVKAYSGYLSIAHSPFYCLLYWCHGNEQNSASADWPQ